MASLVPTRYDIPPVEGGSDMIVDVTIDGDFTDHTFRSDIRAFAGSPTVIHTMFINTPSFSQGKTLFEMRLSDQQTQNGLPDRDTPSSDLKLVYSLKMVSDNTTSPQNIETILMTGTVTITPRITD